MIEIEKHGACRPKKYRTTCTRECYNDCGCTFTFQKEDVVNLTAGFIRGNVVLCPECGSRIPVTTKYCSVVEEEEKDD